MLRLHGETKNPKVEAVAKMTDLMGEMGRNGLRDVEILEIVQREYVVQSAIYVQDCPFVMADNSEDALRRKPGREEETSSDGDGARAEATARAKEEAMPRDSAKRICGAVRNLCARLSLRHG